MKRLIGFVVLGSVLTSIPAFSSDPDWSEGAKILEPRSNPYQYSKETVDAVRERGRLHTLQYPLKETQMLAPYEPIRKLVDQGDDSNPLHQLFQFVLGNLFSIHSMNDFDAWLGLHEYPAENEVGVYHVPYPGGVRPDYRMGVTLIERGGAKGLTYSCAACHSSNLFGKKVLGLTNRFPRANEYFIAGKTAAGLTSVGTFQLFSGATSEEVSMFRELKSVVPYVEARKPAQLGLDTSLAQVALSLSHRNTDENATKNPDLIHNPREEKLRNFISDSKPAVWWNLKYKNRWLSDGSVISGNPIYTNFLWNEIGRGIDLEVLENWLDQNGDTVKELTTAVFSSEAPRFTDFFSPDKIDIQSAKRGQKIFELSCAECHGSYIKGWDQGAKSKIEELQTLKVIYHENTPVKDVGTDPNRYLGMKSLEVLNDLKVSKKLGVKVQAQKGYVPPPLVGIWARWPYFHNNSAPSLCAVLTRASDRPKTYWAGPANDPQKDFDSDCNGYPSGANVPVEWTQKPAFLFDTKRDGLHASGHDEGIFLQNGQEILNGADKKDLILFLQTL